MQSEDRDRAAKRPFVKPKKKRVRRKKNVMGPQKGRSPYSNTSSSVSSSSTIGAQPRVVPHRVERRRVGEPMDTDLYLVPELNNVVNWRPNPFAGDPLPARGIPMAIDDFIGDGLFPPDIEAELRALADPFQAPVVPDNPFVGRNRRRRRNLEEENMRRNRPATWPSPDDGVPLLSRAMSIYSPNSINPPPTNFLYDIFRAQGMRSGFIPSAWESTIEDIIDWTVNVAAIRVPGYIAVAEAYMAERPILRYGAINERDYLPITDVEPDKRGMFGDYIFEGTRSRHIENMVVHKTRVPFRVFEGMHPGVPQEGLPAPVSWDFTDRAIYPPGGTNLFIEVPRDFHPRVGCMVLADAVSAEEARLFMEAFPLREEDDLRSYPQISNTTTPATVQYLDDVVYVNAERVFRAIESAIPVVHECAGAASLALQFELGESTYYDKVRYRNYTSADFTVADVRVSIADGAEPQPLGIGAVLSDGNNVFTDGPGAKTNNLMVRLNRERYVMTMPKVFHMPMSFYANDPEFLYIYASEQAHLWFNQPDIHGSYAEPFLVRQGMQQDIAFAGLPSNRLRVSTPLAEDDVIFMDALETTISNSDVAVFVCLDSGELVCCRSSASVGHREHSYKLIFPSFGVYSFRYNPLYPSTWLSFQPLPEQRDLYEQTMNFFARRIVAQSEGANSYTDVTYLSPMERAVYLPGVLRSSMRATSSIGGVLRPIDVRA